MKYFLFVSFFFSLLLFPFFAFTSEKEDSDSLNFPEINLEKSKCMTEFVEPLLREEREKFLDSIFENHEQKKIPSALVSNLIHDIRMYRCNLEAIYEGTSKLTTLLAKDPEFTKGKNLSLSVYPLGCPGQLLSLKNKNTEGYVYCTSKERTPLLRGVLEQTRRKIDTEILAAQFLLEVSHKNHAKKQEADFLAARVFALNSKLKNTLLPNLHNLQKEFDRLFTNIHKTIPQCSQR